MRIAEARQSEGVDEAVFVGGPVSAPHQRRATATAPKRKRISTRNSHSHSNSQSQSQRCLHTSRDSTCTSRVSCCHVRDESPQAAAAGDFKAGAIDDALPARVAKDETRALAQEITDFFGSANISLAPAEEEEGRDGGGKEEMRSASLSTAAEPESWGSTGRGEGGGTAARSGVKKLHVAVEACGRAGRKAMSPYEKALRKKLRQVRGAAGQVMASLCRET